MNITVAQLVQNSLRLVGAIGAAGRSTYSESTTEVIQFLNQMLSGWNVMRDSLYATTEQTLLLTPNQQSYTIGAGGQFNIPRPNEILGATLIYQTSPSFLSLPIDIINDDEWLNIQVRQIFAIPLKLYYDSGYSQPTGLGTINLWPGPQSAYTLDILVTALLNEALGPSDTLYVPDGYARALVFNLAVEIMPLYPKGLTTDGERRVLRIAAESRRAIENLNSPQPQQSLPAAVLGSKQRAGFNWLVSLD